MNSHISPHFIASYPYALMHMLVYHSPEDLVLALLMYGPGMPPAIPMPCFVQGFVREEEKLLCNSLRASFKSLVQVTCLTGLFCLHLPNFPALVVALVVPHTLSS